MSYPKQLLRLRPTRGIVSDVPSHEVGSEFYTLGQNVLFRRGFAGRLPGYRNAYTAALGAGPPDILHALNVQLSGTNYWLVFGDNEAYSVDGATLTQIDGLLLTVVIDQPWKYSSALLNGVPIITNGADEPVYWSGTGNLTALPGWTATESCKSIAVFKFHVFALDIDGPGGTFPSLVRWSDAAEPGTVPSVWTPASDNEAGDVELSDTPGPVLTAVPLRDMLVIYKRSAMYGAQYVAGNQVFTFQKLQSNSGALTRHSVCDINGRHFVVADGDIVISDGVNRESVGQSRMKDWLFKQLDQDNYENLFAVYNRPKNEVMVGFPSSGSTRCDIALVYDIDNDSFGVRELPDVAGAAIGTLTDLAPSDIIDVNNENIDDVDRLINLPDSTAATESLVLPAAGDLVAQDSGDAVSLPASVGKYDIHFDEPERIKFVKRVHVRAEAGYGTLLVRVGARMTPAGPVTWSAEVALLEPEQIVNTFAQGRYISVEVRSIGAEEWTVTGIDLEAELRGYH